jgi:hypothetical protein
LSDLYPGPTKYLEQFGFDTPRLLAVLVELREWLDSVKYSSFLPSQRGERRMRESVSIFFVYESLRASGSVLSTRCERVV